MKFKEPRKRGVRINITTLIDVMFILLIFFMVTSTFIEQPGMSLELPESEASQTSRLENFTVFVSKSGDLYLNDRPVTSDSLAVRIKRNLPRVKEKTLVIKADKTAQHGVVVQIMDIARKTGLEKVVIGTQLPQPSASASTP